jgi:hypothetical protein
MGTERWEVVGGAFQEAFKVTPDAEAVYTWSGKSGLRTRVAERARIQNALNKLRKPANL